MFPPLSAAGRSDRRRGFTLVEMLLAGFVMSLLVGGLLRLIIQARRQTEAGITQHAVTAFVQGYLEQMKALDYIMLPVSPPSSPSPPSPVTVPLYLVRAGAPALEAVTLCPDCPPQDLSTLSVNSTQAWHTVREINVRSPAMAVHLWVWVEEIVPAGRAATKSKAITIAYAYDLVESTRTVRTVRGSLRTLRTAIPRY